MKVWITKYALSSGIKTADVEVCSGSSTGMVEVIGRPGALPELYHGEGRDWHRTWASASAKAESMRVKKIASLRKQIEKLERLKFEPPQ